ncbi:MAG: hypothetical protein K2V38_13230, partial [Gemmataceae bacterium]|nr:hypothetical protein [Gemmataceae bacterium]
MAAPNWPFTPAPRATGRALALVAFWAGAVALAQPPSGESSKKPADPPKSDKAEKTDKSDKSDAKSTIVKLPDGTFLWVGGADGESIKLSPQAYQKLVDRAEQLKKELAARKPTTPSGCAIRAKVEKRGEQLVAALVLTYTFRTTQPNTAVALGARRTFAVRATLDGANDPAKFPALDATDDGLAVLVESAGDHTLVLEAEAPVAARGEKAEIGFEFGLPRSPITTLTLDPPHGDVKRVKLTTRTAEAPAAKAPAPPARAIDVKQLAPKAGEGGFPLGPAEAVEVTWEPPAAVAQPAEQVQSAELDVGVVLTDGYAESTAKIRLRGPAREWKRVAPGSADVSVERVAAPSGGGTGPIASPTVTKPSDANKPVWKVELPANSVAADWVVTAVVRQNRPKTGAGKSAPVPVGPFAVLDVLRQTGTVSVRAGPHTRFAFKHGPDLRRAELPATDDEISAALFRLTTGPTGLNPVAAPLLTVEVWPVEGTVRVRPVYKLELTEVGWRVRADIQVKPIRTEVAALAVEVPAEWQRLEWEFDPLVVQGVGPVKGEGPGSLLAINLVNGVKQPFGVVLVA